MSAPLEYPFALPSEPTQLQRVAPGVRWLRMPLPFSLDHINLWLIDEPAQAGRPAGFTLVDTGLGDASSREIWRRLLAEHGPLHKIVATHYHPDHLGNAAWLAERCGADVWMSQGEYLLAHAIHEERAGYSVANMLAHFRRHGLDEERLAQLGARGNVYQRGVPELPGTYRRMIDGDTLMLGGDHWQAIAGYGHSPEHMALYCAARGVLISGDMLLPRITTNVSVPAAQPDEDSLARFLQSIHRFADLPADTLVLPSHGKPFRGVQRRVAQLDEHHQGRDALLLEALCSAPKSAAELLSTLFVRELDSHQLMFAMSEAIAHLNHLWHRGAVSRMDIAGQWRFVCRASEG